MALEKFRAPALPLPTAQYDQLQFIQLVNALRIYFNQLDSFSPIQADYFRGRGDKLTFPHIAASDSTDQYATAADTPTIVTWNTLESGSGWTLASNAATAQYAGVYTIRYSLQFVNDDNQIHYATVWLRVNNVDVPNSATIFHVPARKGMSAGAEGYLCGYSEATFTVNAGDSIALYWATNDAATSGGATGVYIYHDVAQTLPYVRPAIPSAIGSISFVSALP